MKHVLLCGSNPFSMISSFMAGISNSKTSKILGCLFFLNLSFFGYGQTTFNFTGAQQTYVVPAGVTEVQIDAYGAQGANNGSSVGGNGGFISGVLSVTPGETLNIFVGGQNGFNGGGAAGTGGQVGFNGQNGGGSSDVRQSGIAYINRIIVAGGGGGAGRSDCTSQHGGAGGYPGGFGGQSSGLPAYAGKNGTAISGGDGGEGNCGGNCSCSPGGGGGGGGNGGGGGGGYGPSQGGFIAAGGTGGGCGQDGDQTGGQGSQGRGGCFGFGGNGGSSLNGGGAGGGGGWFGGGAGGGNWATGGGGGSSYLLPTGTDLAFTNNIQTGNGRIVITVLCDPLTITTTPATNVCPGTIVTIEGTSSNGGTITWDNGISNGVPFTANTTTTYTSSSTNPNDCVATVTITVEDNEAPVITCPGNITQDNDPGICGAVVNYPIPTAIDNCGGGGMTEYIVNGDFETGDLTAWTPVINNATYVLNNGTQDPEGDGTPTPPINGNFDLLSMQTGVSNQMISQPIVVPSGVTASTVRWNDRIRNYAADFADPNQEFKVEILDAAMLPIQEIYSTNPGDPIIQLGPNARSFDITALLQSLEGQTVYLSFSQNTQLFFFNINLDDISLTIGTGLTTTTQTAGLPSGSTFPVGTTTNTFEITDASGNTSSCSFDITVNDTEAPIITCPGDITQSNDPGICGAVVTFAEPTVTDICDGPYGQLLINGDANNGLTGWNLTQNGGNGWAVTGNNKFITSYSLCVKSQVIDLLAIGYSETYLDSSPNIMVSEDYVGAWPNYSDTYFYKAELRDENGVVLASYNTGNLTCTNTVQTVAHNFSGYPIGVRYIFIEHGGYDAEYWAGHYGAVIDNSQVVIRPLTQTAGLPSGSIFPIGTTTNTFQTQDEAGNISTCSFDVIVEDNEAPVISCMPNATRNTELGVCQYTVVGTEFDATFTDNCTSGTIMNDLNGTASIAGEILPKGDTTIVWTVDDGNGQTATCSTVITVEDNEDPIITCVPNATRDTDAGLCEYTVVGTEFDATFTDNCADGSITNDFNGTATLAGEILPKGDTTIVWTVDDGNGQTATCTTVITVEDNEDPIITCVPNATRDTDAGLCDYTVVGTEFDATFTDNCSEGTITNNLNGTNTLAGEILPSGNTTVIWTVNDGNGQTATCITVITIEDNEAPIIACPSDINVNTDAGNCFATVSFSNALALDNCGVDTIVQTSGLLSGSQFPVGINTIEFTATDINGNTNTCSFTITVIDNEAPVAVCQNITIQLDEFGNASITESDVDGGSTDQCGVASTTIDVDTFDCSNVGDNNVILTVTDVNGNSSTCTAIVTVEDITAPIVACQNITLELDPSTGTVTIAGTDIDNGSSDACGIASYNLDIATFDCSNIGDNTVVLTVTDVNGNSETCTAIVTIEDNTSPVLVCQDFTIEIGADGTATLDPSNVIASNDDACGILTVAVDITQFSCADIGTPVTVQVFSQDNNGNLATCMATVTAVDLLAPVVTCPADQTVDPGQGNLFYILPDYFATGEATAMDNCTDPVAVTTQNPAAGTPLSDGVYTITLTATDEYGNTGTCEFELTVESVLGVGNNSQSLTSISMYPNPAKNEVTIGNPQSLELERANIYDLAGRLVKTFNLKGMATAKTLNVDNLETAIYVVIIQGKEGQITKRLLKE